LTYPFRVEELTPLPPPYEIFEFAPCEPVWFHVVAYEFGRIEIAPRWPGAPPRKTVAALRLHMHEEFKPFTPRYWDITPSRLVYALLPFLQAKEHERAYIEVHRTVAGPRARFSIRLVPFEAVAREEAVAKAARMGW